MTNPTTHGQVPAIQRYKIGYHSDEWGVRSSTPGGISDPSGQWVLYKDYIAALVEAQQPAPSGAVALSDYLRDRLVAISEAIADQDDRAAQAMLREILAAPQPSPTAQADPLQPVVALQEIAGMYADDIKPQAYSQSAQGDALTDTYVQQVPDKCDRIVWRGRYYRLPIDAAEHSYTEPSPMAKVAAALRQKAEQEDAAYQARRSDQGLMESEWGPMEDAPPHEDPPMHVAVVGGDDTVRTLQWNRDVAARAPAQSVLEDAARLDFLIEQRAYVASDPDACPGYWLHFFHKETGKWWAQIDEHPTPRAAIDAARKQARRKP